MSIAIYTYRDPYLFEQEPFWNEIKSCPYFCASQTLVNGMKAVYLEDFQQGRVTTVQNLIDAAYHDWIDTPRAIRQYAVIDNVIADLLGSFEGDLAKENVLRALQFNRGEVFKSIRTLFELAVNPDHIKAESLTPEQTLLVEIYRRILRSDSIEAFTLPADLEESMVEEVLIEAMRLGRDGIDYAHVQKDRIVIHGVHQFTPIMLRLIEQISRFRKVILLFNYQNQYKNLYQTWIDIYSAFDCPIFISSGTEFRPDPQLFTSYAGNLLADNLGKMIEGQMEQVRHDEPCEILEFDNITEFANYAADLFEEAVHLMPDSPMSAIREQIYSADPSVNNILKIYFPEQFGERQFLNYPLGRFFVSIANMWDVESQQLLILNLGDVRECLSAGIIQEETKGTLTTIFKKVETLIDGCTTLKEMVSRLKRIKKNRRTITEGMRSRIERLSYYALTDNEVDCLIDAMQELDRLARYFYEDFENQPHNFQRFYRRLKDYLQDEILDHTALDQEFADIVVRVLARLDEVADTDASASFCCLRSTMSVYLVQQRKAHTSANWIVRPFEQLDGDIMRSQSASQRGRTIYHFACLSDEDLLSSKIPPFPWPLNDDFFELAQDPVDWKDQVYVRSRKEYKNFKRYAFLYAMEFNRAGFKLSYVHRKGEEELEYYYMLRLYGVHKTRYQKADTAEHLIPSSTLSFPEVEDTPYSEPDLFRFRLCKYRFLMETIAEGTTVYKDRFLQEKYLEVWLENRVREEMQGLPYSEIGLNDQLEKCYEEARRFFPYLSSVDRMDVINNARRRLRGLKRFPRIDAAEVHKGTVKEEFLRTHSPGKSSTAYDPMKEIFAPAEQSAINAALSEEILSKTVFAPHVSKMCQYCPNKDLCAMYYSTNRRK